MKKERIVYLFGAGAAMDWNGPSTKYLTEKILKIGFKNKGGEFITKKVFDKLTMEGEPDYRKVNFETIINVLEDFVEFWSKERLDQLNGLSFFVSENHHNWNDYLGKWEKKVKYKNTYSLLIDGGGEKQFCQSSKIFQMALSLRRCFLKL